MDLLLVCVLVVGAAVRLAGVYWGESSYMHPDERFLLMVGSAITPLKCQDPAIPVDSCPADQRTWMGLKEYFNTAQSTLNPNNRGYGFYVYGTLPMFLTRYVVQWTYGHSGLEEMLKVGRPLSGLADLLTVLFVYLVGARLYNRRAGLLAAAFSALAVLQIQQSHFFTMDTFVTFFMLVAFYFAVRVLVPGESGIRNGARRSLDELGEDSQSAIPNSQSAIRIPQFAFLRDPLFLPSLGFGLALGLAVASKLNAAAVAVVLPGAMLLRLAQTPSEQRRALFWRMAGFLALAAVVSMLTFRVFQPYAFSGPGLLGLKPNPAWVAQIKEQRNQANGDVDFPPAMQWARRPVWFAAQNLVLWGLGLPLGLLAWGGFLWAAWRVLASLGRGEEWPRHVLLLGWTGLYFAWQSLSLNPTMRYLLPVYPTLQILAAWAVVALWDKGAQALYASRLRFPGPRLLAGILGGVVLAGTAVYALAFTSIYVRPFTRTAASHWILANIPGPINLHLVTQAGVVNQMLPFPYGFTITPGIPYQTSIRPETSGLLNEVYLPHITDSQGGDQPLTLNLTISQDPGSAPLAEASTTVQPGARGQAHTFTLSQPVPFQSGATYTLKLEIPGQAPAPLTGGISLHILPEQGEGVFDQAVPSQGAVLQPGTPYTLNFTPQVGGALTALTLSGLSGPELTPGGGPAEVQLTIAGPGENPEPVGGTLNFQQTPEGPAYILSLSAPAPVIAEDSYFLTINLPSPGGALSLSGEGIANEGDWDDALPLRMDNYDPFGGIYPLDLTFNMYWDDGPDKLARFERILNDSEYVVITSSRQWGSLPRIPERFPMTTVYYRNLIGCPPNQVIEQCYNVAQPGTYHGSLGFDLVKVFESDPQLGPLRLNDQSSEEAFTVYDHPKVFIFKKNTQYDAQKVASLLGGVDFNQIIRLPPLRYGSQPANLMLPEDRWADQQAGGTWADLFNPDALQNRFQALGVIVWYLSVFLLGLLAYPFVRLAMPGLSDHGYPLARTAGMLLLAYFTWLAGSFRIPFTRLTISLVLALLALASAYLAARQRGELAAEWRGRKRYFLLVEALFLGFFLLDLLIRFGNPDLWHPYKGGEKPMDFSYFNAILKSTSFPPYDPWFAGGYLNYYYFGFVFVGVLVKLLGIIPAFAYNLILPTLFSLIAMGAFSIAWNLVEKGRGDADVETQDVASLRGAEGRGGRGREARPPERSLSEGDGPVAAASQVLAAGGGALAFSLPGSTVTTSEPAPGTAAPRPELQGKEPPSPASQSRPSAWVAAVAAALGTALLGNLGTVRMITQGWERLAAPGGTLEGAGMLTRWVWALRGLAMSLSGAALPYGPGDWYWLPSRAIPAQGDVEPITEFPFFTVLYGDPHAHLFALPITLLALGFVLAVVLSGARWKSVLGVAVGFFIGGLAIGALRPTNTWDLPTYLALGLVGLVYALWKDYNFRERGPGVGAFQRIPGLNSLPAFSQRLLLTGLACGALVGLSILLYQPYAAWYGSAYVKFDLWKGPRTPVDSYLTHWGLFLFVLVSWMAWETRQWMASTPVSSLRKLEPYRVLIETGAVLLVGLVAGLVAYKVQIAWLALPLAAWAGVLLLRPGLPDAKRFVLFLVGTGLVLTLMVEVLVLRGDIGRMNTVFKFYLQVWVLFAAGSGAALFWLLGDLAAWLPSWRYAWKAVLGALVLGAALYPYMAGIAKVQDRMVTTAPHTLDGMTYMEYAQYDWQGLMNLDEDYQAIRWMQANIPGSPVIVEANLRDLYRWGSRYTIYTGLPGVVGWEWHQQQQRAVVPGSWVTDRILEIDSFYNTTDLVQAQNFLRKYNVRYIVVGQLERNHYPGPGLDKFPAANGVMWREVFRLGKTVIYQVLEK